MKASRKTNFSLLGRWLGHRPKCVSGQATVEYILMIAVGSIFAMQMLGFFNGIFRDGFLGLEQNIKTETRTGAGYDH